MNVQCSWKVSDGRPISDAIFYSGNTENADLEDEINVENCVFLKAPDKSEGLYPTIPACQLLICCEPLNQITHISAICEARVMEIYGHHGEYLKTVFNSPLEETENLFVYRGDVTLDKPLSVCSVKFVNLESQNEMWLFGVKIHTEKAACSSLNQRIPSPLAAIQQKLESMKDSSEDKDALKKFLDSLFKMGLGTVPATSSSVDENLPANWQNLLHGLPNSNLMKEYVLKNLEKEITIEKPEEITNCSDDNCNFQLSSSRRVPNTSSTSTSPVMFLSQSTSTQTEEDYTTIEENLKMYVNKQMQSIDKKLLEIETKIMCKLEEIESFVKPQGVQDN